MIEQHEQQAVTQQAGATGTSELRVEEPTQAQPSAKAPSPPTSTSRASLRWQKTKASTRFIPATGSSPKIPISRAPAKRPASSSSVRAPNYST